MAENPVVKKVEEQTPEAPVKGPADDIRQIQMLLVNGIFPGSVAPQVVASYSLLEKMAQQIENAPK